VSAWILASARLRSLRRRTADLSISEVQSRPAAAPRLAAAGGPVPATSLRRQSTPMPSKTSPQTLAAFIRQQDADTLASVLIELAEDHEAVHERLVRLQLSNQPRAFGAAFRKKLSAWKRSPTYIDYAQAGDFGRELEAWLAQVERELMPQDPAEALALVEAFIETDEVFFECADDSGGAIGSAMHAGCLLWLRAASHCESPAAAWPDRIMALVAADQYGAREALLRHADLLLSEAAMRALVASCEAQLGAAVTQPGAAPTQLNWPAARASAALSLLAEALRDPDVLVRAVLRRSPVPNPAQKASLAEAFLRFGRPDGALPWLEGSWEHLESSRERLRAQALTALGRAGEAAAMHQRIFEASLAVEDLHAWLDLLAPSEHPRAFERARQLAGAHSYPVMVALLLLDIGDDAAAEAALARAPAAIHGRDYGTLVPLAMALEHKGFWTGATAVYRALLVAILDRAYAPAYRHAARYWARLQALALKCPRLMPLEPPDAFEARIRAQHKRKTSFWAHVNGGRRTDDDTESDPKS